MDYFVGIDASLETVNVCIVDRDGSVLLEQKVDAEPQEIVALLKRFGHPLKRIGLEAGPTSSWLFSELRAAGYPALCLECRHVKAGLSAMRNKTDRNDARGIAHLVRLGWFRLVHVKSEEAQQIRTVNRHGRFRDGDIFRQLFEAVVRACMDAVLVKGEGFAVDASVIEADASRYHGKAPDEIDWSEPKRQTRAIEEFLSGLDEATPTRIERFQR